MQFQLDLSDNSNSSQSDRHLLPLKDGQVQYYPQWLSQADSDRFLEQLRDELEWRQDSIKLFGRWVKIPRLQAWYGESHCQYGYSGLALTPLSMTPSLERIKSKCEHTAGAPFNCVLANWYRDGQDSMSMHADDEPELGERPVIASVTLGQARSFDFKHKHTDEKHRIVLEHGSLLIMAGDTQTYYNHGINKTKRVQSPRINLTYRYIHKP